MDADLLHEFEIKAALILEEAGGSMPSENFAKVHSLPPPCHPPPDSASLPLFPTLSPSIHLSARP